MIYAAILAGGLGKRLGSNELPKQFIKLDKAPIIIHTLEKFVIYPEISKIFILVPKKWIIYTKDLVSKYIENESKVIVIEGGEQRHDTVDNCISYIEENFGLNDEDSIITHDAVRPFISYRIIEDNIKYVKKYGAVDTVIKATDTIVRSADSEIISEIPDRKQLYMGQTPQSFNIKKLVEVTKSLTKEERSTLTDACKIFTLKGLPVYMVKGDQSNIKITYQYDLDIANYIVAKGRKRND